MDKALTAAAPTKVVLFDVDGVIYRNRPMLLAVKRKIARYVKTRIEKSQKTYLSYSDAERISDNLYVKYGHTLRGMWQIYGCEREFPIEDFNEYVYDDDMINMLTAQLAGSELNEDLKQYVRLCKHNHDDVKFGIFSNAPTSWCRPIVSHYGLEINPFMMYTSSHSLFGQRFKPDASLYEDIATTIAMDHELPIRFIDDSEVNIAAVAGKPEWAPVKFAADW